MDVLYEHQNLSGVAKIDGEGENLGYHETPLTMY